VLVVVEHRNVQRGPQARLHLEAAGLGDVLQVDAPEAGGDRGDRGHDAFDISGVQADGDGVDVSQVREQGRLAFHHQQRRGWPEVAQAEDGGAVGDDCDSVVLAGQVPDGTRDGRDPGSDSPHPRGVGEREVLRGTQSDPDAGAGLAAAAAFHRQVRAVDQLEPELGAQPLLQPAQGGLAVGGEPEPGPAGCALVAGPGQDRAGGGRGDLGDLAGAAVYHDYLERERDVYAGRWAGRAAGPADGHRSFPA
jgi:hypothetical protein